MFPELETQRFFLTQILREDQAFVFRGLSHPDVIIFYGVQFDTLASTKTQMEFYDTLWSDKTGCWWKIVDKLTQEAIGACGMNAYNALHEKAEIGYWLLPEHWKKGVMTEVLPVMISHLFATWKLHRLEAVVEAGNDTSGKLAEKLGFQFEGTLREAEIKHGKRISLQVYSLLNTDLHK